MATQSPHLTDIPQAIRIAASTDAVDPALKQQALDYLTKVKELCGETWQVSGDLRLAGHSGNPQCAHAFWDVTYRSALSRLAQSCSDELQADMSGLSFSLPPGSRCACRRPAGTRWQGEARRKPAHVLPAGCRHNSDEEVR